MITSDDFKCTFCGKCCIELTVKISDEDIKRIKKAGHKRKDFAVKDMFDLRTGKYALKKQENEWCVFLRKEGEKYLCSIHEHRPETCRKYPFFDDTPLKSCLPEDVLHWPAYWRKNK
ncbi:YkgJ family cysteine cluster protein [Candidatus Woesearchaeota archaeon]|nr:YkgJ family cysteine cluster protein [Candidatus Woesearchaeota archaeon]